LRAACAAPSSFNSQPYRLIWIETPAKKEKAAELCLGQSAAKTASVLVVAVADLGLWNETGEGQLRWMREADFPRKRSGSTNERPNSRSGLHPGLVQHFRRSEVGDLRTAHLWKVIGMVPASRQGLFKWATKSTALASANLMIAAEALGWNTARWKDSTARDLQSSWGSAVEHRKL